MVYYPQWQIQWFPPGFYRNHEMREIGKPLWDRDFCVVTMQFLNACLFCWIVWVSTMPHGKIASCQGWRRRTQAAKLGCSEGAACVLWSSRQRIGKSVDSLLPNRLLRSPEQGASLWQSDQVDTNLRAVNTEDGLLLQSERPITYCACLRTTLH